MPGISGSLGRDTTICRISTLQVIDKESGGLDRIPLDPDEVRRSEAIRHPHRRAQFLAGRWLTRQLFCEALGGGPASWPITCDAANKPRVQHRNDLHLSISHSKELIACAIAGQPIGLDIERIDASREVGEMAQMIDAGQSVEHNCDRNEVDQFTLAWTLKEACIKHTGDPFDIAVMRRMHLALCTPQTAQLANWIAPGRFTLSLSARAVSLAHLRWDVPAQLCEVSYYRVLAD